MGKPDYEEFLSGIPGQPNGLEKPDDNPVSEPADQRDTSESPSQTEQSNQSEPIDVPEQPDPSGHAKQSGQSTQSIQADQSGKSNQPRQSTSPCRANQSRQSNQSNQSNQPDMPKQASHTEQPGELITFSVRMPTEYIDAIKAIAWWERRTHRAFFEEAVDRYRQTHGQAHLDEILADYHNQNS